MKNLKNKVWFVTGASKGLGLTLVKRLLNDGYQVAATSRSKQSLIEAIGTTTENFLPLEVELTNEESIKAAVAETLKHFNTIDILVNNAGYGQIGTVEELSDEEVRNNYDVNVFGLLNVTRQVLPHLRAKQSGHIFNISSIGGFVGGFAAWGIYCSTKFAVAGLTEALAVEAKPFGVNVTLVYPGYFRTNFLSKDSVLAPKNPIDDYLEARQSQAAHQNEIDGNQPGDPDKAIDVLIEMSKEQNPPLHLFLGQDAYDISKNKLEEVSKELEHWKSYTLSTGF